MYFLFYFVKVFFHFKTISHNDQTVIDDSKKMDKNKPMEIIIGKNFKLEIWERAIKTMWLGEIAQFSVVKEVLK
jgi:AH receptor-interacting protein